MFLTMMMSLAVAEDVIAWPNDCRVDITLAEDGKRTVSHDNCDAPESIAAWADALKLPEGQTGTVHYLLAKDHFVPHGVENENMKDRAFVEHAVPKLPSEAKEHGFQSEAWAALTVAPSGKVTGVELLRCPEMFAKSVEEGLVGNRFEKADTEGKLVMRVTFAQ
ncbi:MAG: hypothetical protein GY913_20925 [Proteobacteria bacterium]|nr:hypothetical protein [Pseudomonadota bacterium]MCP4919371.1 hypothetical protein [Pseudomonadota bacterium]